MNNYSYIPNMYILGGQVYEDEEIMVNYNYLSVYDQNPDEYIAEDCDCDCMYEDDNEQVSLSFELMEKMNINQTLHFS
jgi:hypothetical protein